eukprot:4664227-Pyramimonas_sp.AAC.1
MREVAPVPFDQTRHVHASLATNASGITLMRDVATSHSLGGCSGCVGDGSGGLAMCSRAFS